MYKKLIAWILIVSGILLAAPFQKALAASEPELKISARAAVLMNADSGEILYAKNENERLAMASTTKIMTALLTLEEAQKQDEVVTVTDAMVQVEGSSMGLHAGDQLTLKGIAAGMLSVSGNDAANTAAIAVAGSTQAFAEKMNQRAQELGMENTHFVTPSGLDDEQHYSARDMAVLASAAMKNSDFAELAGQKRVRVPFINPAQTVAYTNHNKLLDQYPGCIGVKTGFTKKAGRCLVSAAERDGIRLISVTLHDPDDWKDHATLLDYGFSQLVRVPVDDSSCRWQVPVVGGTQGRVMVYGEAGTPVVVRKDSAERVQRVVELPHFLYAGIEAGQVVGSVRYMLDGKQVAATPLTAQATVEYTQPPKNLFQKIIEAMKHLLP